MNRATVNGMTAGKLSLLLLSASICTAAFGLTNVYWAGGESGDWSDPNNVKTDDDGWPKW